MILVLPVFELLKRQPNPPHVALVVVERRYANPHGAQIIYTVRRSRKGKDWWLYATYEGFRMSNTLHTTVEAKAKAWVKAVRRGTITIEEGL